MSRQVPNDVLRRMVSPPPPAPEDVPITSSRAVRMAVTRAADKTHGMPLSVMGLREEVVSLDDMLAMPAEQDMLVALNRAGVMVGLAAIDQQFRAALAEVQTVGHVLNTLPEDRPATVTDCALVLPLLRAFFEHLDETAARTPIEGWGAAAEIGNMLSNTRAAGLILPEGNYRAIRMTIDLHVEGREGTLMLVLPDHHAPVVEPPPAKDTGNWTTRFQAAVNAAPMRLDAELCRFKLPLSVAQELAVGQVLPLIGCQVSSVKLRAKDGRRIATARLGQAGGMRAIRIETPPSIDMQELEDGGQGTGMIGLPAGDMDGLGAMDTAAGPEMADDMAFDMNDFDTSGPGDADAEEAVSMDLSGLGESATIGGNGEDELAWDLEADAGDGAAPMDLDWSAEGLADDSES